MNKELWQRAAIISGLAFTPLVIWRLWRHFSIDADTNEMDLPYTTATPHELDNTIYQGERSPQFLADGYGPLFHRRYYVDIKNTQYSKTDLMQHIQDNLNEFAPNDIAIFERVEDDKTSSEAQMNVGDDYYIHIAGPWDGPVRVIDVTPESFSFITLDDHMEAGEIQFRLIDSPQEDNAMRFEIRSWSRSNTRLVHLFCDVISFAKFSQERMWVFFCQRVLEMSEGESLDDVQVITHRVPFRPVKKQAEENLETWQQYQPKIERIRNYELNFDLDERESFTEENGWRIDDYEIDLPQENSGMPEEDGSWQLAKEVMLNYEFPDPDLIAGIYVPDEALEERHMVLRARFLIFEFEFGVRISEVIDEKRTDDDKGEAQVWGYSYQTLEDHFEMGEITFTVWKFLETGQVEFRIHSYSRTGHISNPFYRFGFLIFGRMLQKRFAETSLKRTQKLVTERLTQSDEQTDVPEVMEVA